MDKNEQELLKSLCSGIVGDISRLLCEKGYNRPVATLELVVFGMFIVTETYMLAKKGSSDAEGRLDEFHRNMADYVFNADFLKQNPYAELDELLECFDKFHEHLYNLVVARYPEYRKVFSADLEKHHTTLRSTIASLLGHLFPTPLSENDIEDLLIPLALKVFISYIGCLTVFKGNGKE